MTAAEAEDGGSKQQQQRKMTTATAEDDNGNSGWQQKQTTTALDGNDMQDWVADYEGEGGEQGIRARPAESVKNKEIEFMQKDFFQQYGLSGWNFCSRWNTQCPLWDLSVLHWCNKLR
jgi:hypothetical protein